MDINKISKTIQLKGACNKFSTTTYLQIRAKHLLLDLAPKSG